MLNHSAVPHQVHYSLIPLLSYLHDCFTLFFPVLNACLFQQPVIAHQFMSLRKNPSQSLPTSSRWQVTMFLLAQP